QGVEVDLIDCATGGTVGTTTTDANGYYLFSGVPAGEYKVCFELPDGCTSCFILECDKPNLTKDAGLCEKKEEGGEGCTPGFWKNHLGHWAATGYSPNDVFDDVFGCELFGDDTTLGWAVNNSGVLKNLAFHAVAALLNAASPDVDYAYSVGEVIDTVCDAVASGDLEGGKNILAAANESLCPLSGGVGPTLLGSSSLKVSK
ncbi:MAG TPA: SdrD B-like domain-containing protein, partial [Candidatus Krumholzibacteria bacterium]|nr:SdrD B-like domain-containing protein [Candidatus Krumholzibacteria bacterium]